jgi:hypothetical protein
LQDCADRRDLLDQLAVLRAFIEGISVAALRVERTKPCARSVAGLLDACNNLAAMLSR